MTCNCEYQDIRHWWKYHKFRYHWRNFKCRLRYSKRMIDGEIKWVRNYIDFDYDLMQLVRVNRIYDHYPGPNMTRDEWEHWFKKPTVIDEAEEILKEKANG